MARQGISRDETVIMANEPTLVAEKRERTGSAECRRLRREGMTPGNLYGHGITGIPLKVASDALNTVIHSGSHLVRLDLAGKTETALFQEVQWDTFGVRIEHFDLLRVGRERRVVVAQGAILVATLSEQQAAIADLRNSLFSGPDLRRVESLEAVGQLPPGG